jgi:spermidine synthase
VLIDLLGGVAPAFLAVVVLNLGVGVALVCSGATGSLQKITVAGSAWAAALLAIAVLPAGVFRKVFEDRYGELSYYKEGVTDTTLVATGPEEGNRKPFLFYGDGRGVAGVSTFQENRMSGHLPLLLHGAPKRVLVICYGVGNTLGAMTRHSDVEHFDCVELSPHVVETSRFFTETNHDPLADPRVELIVQDGRNFLLATDRTYDVIGLEPPEIHTAGVVNLYTKEFYELCREHLTATGLVIQWFNIGVTPEPVARMLVKAMDAVFPHTTLWQAPQHYSWLIVGSMRPLAIDWGRLSARMAQDDVRQDLVEAGIAEPAELLSWLVLTEPGVDGLVEGVPVITDDRTIVDFLAPKSPVALFGGMHYSSAYKDWSHYVQTGGDVRQAFRERVANFRISHELRESPAPMLVNLPEDTAERERVLRDLAARVQERIEGNRRISDDTEVGK